MLYNVWGFFLSFATLLTSLSWPHYPCSKLLAQVEVNSMDEHSFVKLQGEDININLSGITPLSFEIENLFKDESSILSLF